MTLLISVLCIIAGFAGLIWSSDRFVSGASTTARNLGVSPLIIGLTIVAFGTSSPEIFTSAVASLQGSPELSLGNVIGSNIANIGLVLGLTLIVSPIAIPDGFIKKEVPALLGLTGLCFFLFYDLRLTMIDGLILVLVLMIFCWFVFKNKNLPKQEEEEIDEEVADYISDISTTKATLLMFFGLALLLISSNILVYGAKNIAIELGMSELVIGLTIVAIGTSLPELATSITSTLKGHDDLALGNIVGSNILNLLLVLPVPAFLSPFAISQSVLWRDYLLMAGLTAFLAILIYHLSKSGKPLNRLSGGILLLVYIAYTAFLLLNQ